MLFLFVQIAYLFATHPQIIYSLQLTGTIPNELGYMASALELDLSANELTGSIPGQLGQLRELIQLRLSSNNLNGTFPTELPP